VSNPCKDAEEDLIELLVSVEQLFIHLRDGARTSYHRGMQSKEHPSWSTAEYWQGRFEKSDTPWQLNVASTVLMEAIGELESRGFSLEEKRVLSPGCGRGLDALEVASKGARVLAVDWSATAVADLKSRYEALRSSCRGVVEVVAGDFFAMEPQPVDLVLEHTFFCALDPSMRTVYAEKVAQWTKPGGFLVGNFFILGEELAQALPGLSLTHSGEGPPFASTVKELHGLLLSNFEEVIVRPAKNPDPDRRPGMEWVGIFRRR
jgi:thiopurine S-methyltransferase